MNYCFFFFNDTATTEIYTLSLHDALPISFVVDANGLPKAVTTPTWNARNAFYVASINDTLDPRVAWSVGRDSVPYKDWGLHLPKWILAPRYGGPHTPTKNVPADARGAAASVGWATG